MAHGTITLDPTANPQDGAAFTITGTLTVTPSVTYTDDGGAAKPVSVADLTQALSINHPGLPAGSHSVVVSDAVTGASATDQVTVGGAAAVFIGANQSFTDAAGNVFRIDGQENAYETPKGGSEVGLGTYGDIGWNAEQMAYYNNVVYIQDIRDNSWHTFNGSAFSGTVAAPPGSPSNPPPPPSGAPPQAAAVGYNTRTYGPDVTLGTNWFPFAGANLTQNADGSITDHGAGANDWNAHFTPAIGSTGDSSGTVVGCIFDGGGYFEATISWANPPAESYQNPDGSHSDGWPAFWSVTGSHDFTYLGDLPNRQNLELDTYEAYDPSDNSFFNCGIIHWYTDQTGVEYDNNTAGISPTAHAPAGVDVTQPHKIGFLWVPATATTKGYVKTYYDGVEAGPTYTWDQWTGGNVPGQDVPPFSAMDVGGRRILVGTGTKNPLTLHAFEAWQKDASKNHGTLA